MKALFYLVSALFTFGWPLRWGYIHLSPLAVVAWALIYAVMSVAFLKWRRESGSIPASLFYATTFSAIAFFIAYGVGWGARALGWAGKTVTPLNAVLASIAISYVWAGRRWVNECMSANSLQKPFWAYSPTLGKAVLAFVTWPFGVAAPQIYGHPGKEMRYAAAALVEICFRMLPAAALCFFVWYAWSNLAY